MLSVQEIRDILLAEGYFDVYDWYDSPEFEYHEHAHSGATVVWVLDGVMDLGLPNETIRVAAGERYDIEAGVLHTATMGPTGCQYIIGEKPTS
jgi:uncharacterized protein YjlB